MTKFVGWLNKETYEELIKTKRLVIGQRSELPWMIFGQEPTAIYILDSMVDAWFVNKIGILFDISHDDVNISNGDLIKFNFCIYMLQNVTPLRTIENIDEYRDIVEEYNNERLK